MLAVSGRKEETGEPVTLRTVAEQRCKDQRDVSGDTGHPPVTVQTSQLLASADCVLQILLASGSVSHQILDQALCSSVANFWHKQFPLFSFPDFKSFCHCWIGFPFPFVFLPPPPTAFLCSIPSFLLSLFRMQECGVGSLHVWNALGRGAGHPLLGRDRHCPQS